MVTGGAGFLGRYVVSQLRDSGAGVVAPRKRDYDLVERAACRRLVADHRPDVVLHLAARVGGIGANRENPGAFFFENVMMGVQLLEECRLASVPKVVTVGTICAYPKHTPVPFREEALWDGYPEETNAPYGLAKKMLLVQGQAYRQQYGDERHSPAAGQSLRPRRQFRRRDLHVIPALIVKVQDAIDAGKPEIVAWGTGRASREFLFVEDAARAICLATERFDGADPVNLGAGFEISDLRPHAHDCEVDGFLGQHPMGHEQA